MKTCELQGIGANSVGQRSGCANPSLCHIYVTMSIGEQEKPYFLDIDTGSTLTWLECIAF